MVSNINNFKEFCRVTHSTKFIFNVGCPSIDAILNTEDDPDILNRFGLKLNDYFILLQHPVTSEYGESRNQILTTLSAIKNSNVNAIIILPNNDAGYSKIIHELKGSNIKFIESLKISDYINLLKRSTGLIGNSSSGIHETSTFNIPTVNIGTRQNGRLRPKNVIDVDYDEKEILKAILKCKQIRKNGTEFENPYGDGNSANKIIELIKKLELSRNIIQKKITY